MSCTCSPQFNCLHGAVQPISPHSPGRCVGLLLASAGTGQGWQLGAELCHCSIPPPHRQMWNEQAAAGTRGLKGQLKEEWLSKASSSSRGLWEGVNPDMGTTRWVQHRQQTQLSALPSSKLHFNESPAFMKNSPRLVFVSGTKQLEFYLRQ